MQTTQIGALNSAFETAHLWLRDLADAGGFAGEEEAYTALRAALHALRDRLTVDEAAHLSAQLPLVVRGLYFQEWKPGRTPTRQRSLEEFLGAVRAHLGPNTILDPERACRGVFDLLDRRISAGEIADVRHMLPEEVRALWPARGSRGAAVTGRSR